MMRKVVRVELDFNTISILALRQLGDDYIPEGTATVRVAGWKVKICREDNTDTFEEFHEADKGEAIRYALEVSAAHGCEFIDLTKEST
jgi:hypothetical protein